MKKFLLLSFFTIALLSCSSCTTVDNNDGINPRMNDESFTNYVPWWATNNIQGATNVESTVTNTIPQD